MPKTLSHRQLQNQNQRIFTALAGRYDFMNKVTSLGMEPFWKRRLVKCLAPVKNDTKILDLCAGTGDLTNLALKQYQGGHYALYDLNAAMLKAARRKIAGLRQNNVEFMRGDAMDLPFADNSLDKVMMCFGLRNVPHMQGCLNEVSRVLKPGGQFVCLEFAVPRDPLLRRGYNLYMASFVRLASTVITGSGEGYRYLSSSIARFAPPAKVREAIANAGLENKRQVKLFCGIGYIYEAFKL